MDVPWLQRHRLGYMNIVLCGGFFDTPTIMIQVHKERTEALNEVDVANELVGDSEHRLRTIGKFQ